jgi:hypothetical protein
MENEERSCTNIGVPYLVADDTRSVTAYSQFGGIGLTSLV